MTTLQFILLAPAVALVAATYVLLAWLALFGPERPARPEELDEHDAWLADWQARHTDPEALARRNQE